MSKKIFIGVAWPYVNGPLHIGHLAGAYLSCDFFARYQRLRGSRVLMVSGSDMHGTPTTVAAKKEGVSPLTFANRYHLQDKKTFNKLGVSFDLYTKTSTKNHQKVVQDFFLTLYQKGFLFKKITTQPFCKKCKRFLPDRYIEGKCPHCGNEQARGDQCDQCGKTLDTSELINPQCKHCGGTPIFQETEHFFLDLPQFSDKLKNWVLKQSHWRQHVREFTLGWLKEGLKPRAVTRDLDYGIPVPIKGFESKVIYVWFEAVIGYLSASIEWAQKRKDKDKEFWKEFWCDPFCKHYYFIGKDNIPFHSIIWPSMLMGYDANLQLPYDIPANNFLTLEGKPLSKSRDWFVTADELLTQFNPDAIRFYFAYNNPEVKDLDFSSKKFIQENNSLLVGTLGNFIHRTLVFTNHHFNHQVPMGKLQPEVKNHIEKAFKDVSTAMEVCSFRQAIRNVLELAQFGNIFFDQGKPWEEINSDRKCCAEVIYNSIQIISALKVLLIPFLPFAAAKLHKQLGYKFALKKETWDFSPIPAKTRLIIPTPLFSKY